MAEWKFYGRKERLADLERILDRKHWFFAKVTGRRRIGKTTLIQKELHENRQHLLQTERVNRPPIAADEARRCLMPPESGCIASHVFLVFRSGH